MRVLKIVGLALIACIATYLLWLPNVNRLKTKNPESTPLIERRIRQAAKKKKILRPQRTWRNLKDISPNLTHAVLLAEDDTFYRHHGFDFEQIRIAVKINLKKGRFAYGGSTLTQQLARTLYLSTRKSILRKLKEAVITAWMEAVLPKKRILELYLNYAEWGDGIFGAEAAARHYFGKSSSDLSPEESVALASILPSPRKWDPLKTTKFMGRRRGNILARMRMEGYIPSEAEKETERSELSDELPEDEDGFEVHPSSGTPNSSVPSPGPAPELSPETSPAP